MLEQLSSAILVAQHLDELADHLIGHFVDRARRAGASWADIGHSMGVTKQAAQQRSVPRDPADVSDLAVGRFGRFTTRARHVVIASQEAARHARNPEIEPVHVVLGMLAEPTAIAGSALVAQGFTLDAIRQAATAALPESGAEVPDHIPFGVDAKKVLELTFRHALRFGHNYIGTEHIVLALLEFEHGDGILSGLGLTLEATETTVRSALAG